MSISNSVRPTPAFHVPSISIVFSYWVIAPPDVFRITLECVAINLSHKLFHHDSFDHQHLVLVSCTPNASVSADLVESGTIHTNQNKVWPSAV